MSTRTWKKCPHCGRTYETYTTYTKNWKHHYGSPFIKCKFCNGHFVDKDIKEPALKSEKSHQVTIVNCIFAMFIPFGLMGIVLTIYAHTISASLGLWIIASLLDLIYFLSVIYSLIKRSEHNLELRHEYAASYNRLKNPVYAYALKNAGFKVPQKFLEVTPEEHFQNIERIQAEREKKHTDAMREAMLREHFQHCKKCGHTLNALQIVCDKCGERRSL